MWCVTCLELLHAWWLEGNQHGSYLMKWFQGLPGQILQISKFMSVLGKSVDFILKI